MVVDKLGRFKPELLECTPDGTHLGEFLVVVVSLWGGCLVYKCTLPILQSVPCPLLIEIVVAVLCWPLGCLYALLCVRASLFTHGEGHTSVHVLLPCAH